MRRVVYISTAGRLFDYSKTESTNFWRSRRSGGGSTNNGALEGMKVVRFGEKWLQGNVGQRWDPAPNGLIRTRIYPWGREVYTIEISSDLRTCTITDDLISSLPDNNFFFFRSGNQHDLLNVRSHETAAASCSITVGNIFDNVEQ
jgi:hypothetical protein